MGYGHEHDNKAFHDFPSFIFGVHEKPRDIIKSSQFYARRLWLPTKCRQIKQSKDTLPHPCTSGQSVSLTVHFPPRPAQPRF